MEPSILKIPSEFRRASLTAVVLVFGVLIGRGTSWIDWDLVMRGLKGGNIDPSYCGVVRNIGQPVQPPAPVPVPVTSPAPILIPEKPVVQISPRAPEEPHTIVPAPMAPYRSILDTPLPVASAVKPPAAPKPKEEPSVSVDLSRSKRALAQENKPTPAASDAAK